MCRTKIELSLALLGILTFAVPKTNADTCPDGAVSTGVGIVLTPFRTNSAGALVPIGPGGVGICETIFLQGSLSYVPFDSQGNIVAAFEGGQVVIETGLSNPSFSQVVTPDGGVPKIGPLPSTCTPPAVSSLVATKVAKYTINPADIVSGQVQFFIVYSGGNAHIGTDLNGVESATTAINVRVSTGPSCSILPATQTVCAGASATFTASATGQAPPFTFTWTGPNGFTATGATITINNAQAANAGTYTATVKDAFGCISTCTAVLVVTPNPTCAITGDSPVCPGTTHTYTSTVSPSGGTVTHSWSISGSGTINGSTTGASVSVTAGATGSFTLTDNVTRDNCPGQCTLNVPINPPPTCAITGDNPVCPGTTHSYTSAVSPSGGTVTHSWSISGNGTINGATDGPTVSVTAGATGSFTLTDNVTRDGCPGQCTLTVNINPPPTCAITGDTPVCPGTTHTYNSTVSPAGGTVTHSWSISGSGTINGSTTGASVSVTAGASGSFTLTDNVTRDGCPGQCTLTVPINPPPTCAITGDNPVCPGTTHSYTSAVSPSGGTVTHSWSISGNGTINGATDGPTVSVTAGATGSFTLTDSVTRDGCPGQCTLTVNINPPPTCAITGDNPVCPATTHTYTSTVLPAGGTVTHSWSISGSGTINGSTSGASVSVTAGASGSFTLTDNVTRDGCPGQCTLTVNISPAPTCSITGDSPVCTGTTHTYTSAVSPAGGTVTHSWSITGNGTINGSTTGASVSVTAGAAGTFTLTDNITRDGCPGQCTLTVTVIPCKPSIEVFKQVVCVGSDGKCQAFSDDLTAQSSASGVKGATCPAFCYRITVRNSSPDVPLQNVTVSDPNLNLSGCSFATSLDPGQSTSCIIPNVERCTDLVNTVTARGVSAFDSTQSATATDTATVTVVPISVACDITLFSQFDDDNNPNDNHVTLLDSGPVDFSLTVHNTGSADLSVAIVGLPCSVDLDGNPIPTTLTIPVGGSSNFVCSVEVVCPQGTNITVTVTGTAVASTSVPCVFDVNGKAITTVPSSCSASVSCAQPVTCRVTGGGTLIDGTVDVSCINVPTTISPLVVNGLTVNKITHGGQLGAPFSQMDCGAILGNPCIRGQWQHTRHYQGQGNPRDVIDMNFHSVTPKGQFDSLSCACLGCCDPATGAFIPPSVGPLIHKFALCNPDDHKVCGPQPRPAPANAIIFSGVGKLTPTSDTGVDASRSEWVVFRVYIEDRSEPGGFHPKGAVEPADIYCFQAWKTGIRTTKKPDFTDLAAAFRTALGQANCDFLGALESGALPIGSLPSPVVNGLTADIQDCGPLHDGNQQIHPSTGATCNQ